MVKQLASLSELCLRHVQVRSDYTLYPRPEGTGAGHR